MLQKERAHLISFGYDPCINVKKALIDVVDELYTNLPPTDIAMREIVCRLVGFAIKDKEQRDRMGDVMRKHGDFAVGVMNYMLASEDHVWA